MTLLFSEANGNFAKISTQAEGNRNRISVKGLNQIVGPGYLSPALTFTRAQAANVQASAVNFLNTGLDFFAANTPRFAGPSRRLLNEDTAVNLINGMAAPSTQNIAVSAGNHVLTFYGTGSITLSGAATGTLTGTGAGNRVALPFTATTGTLTLTVSGTVTRAQLETGGYASSYVEASSGAATRGADNISGSLSSFGIGTNGACTVLFRGLCPVNFSLLTEGQLACISDGGFLNFARLVITGVGGGGQLVLANRTAGVDTITVLAGGARPTGSLFSCGVSFHGTGRVTGVWNGSSVGAALGAPASGYTTFDLFHLRGILPLVCEAQKVDLLPFSLSDTELQTAVSTFL